MADLIDKQAVIALAKDICVPTGDGGVYRTRSIDPQEVRELPAVQPDHNADISKKAEGDCISRQAALDAIMGQPPEPHYPSWYAAQIEKLPAAQPDHVADSGKKVSISCGQENDLISRQAAIDEGSGT